MKRLLSIVGLFCLLAHEASGQFLRFELADYSLTPTNIVYSNIVAAGGATLTKTNGSRVFLFTQPTNGLASIAYVDSAMGPMASAFTNASVIYVETNGYAPASAIRGDPSHPFNTLTGAVALAQSGDVIMVGAGTHYVIDSRVSLPDNVSLVGRGPHATRIVGNAILNTAGQGPIVNPGDNAFIGHLTIQGTNQTTFQAPIGVTPISANLFTNVLVQNVETIGHTDGFYADTNSGLVEITFQSCVLSGTFDQIFMNADTNSIANFIGCRIYGSNVVDLAVDGQFVRNVNVFKGRVRLDNCSLQAYGGAIYGANIYTADADARVWVNNCSLETAQSGVWNKAITNNAGTVWINGSDVAFNEIAGPGGTILGEASFGGLTAYNSGFVQATVKGAIGNQGGGLNVINNASNGVSLEAYGAIATLPNSAMILLTGQSDLRFGNARTEAGTFGLFDSSTKNFGIATNSPQAKLHVHGNAIIASNLTAQTLTMTSGASGGYVLTSDGGGAATWQPSSMGASSNFIANLSGSGTNNMFYMVTLNGAATNNGSLYFPDLTASRFLILNSSGVADVSTALHFSPSQELTNVGDFYNIGNWFLPNLTPGRALYIDGSQMISPSSTAYDDIASRTNTVGPSVVIAGTTLDWSAGRHQYMVLTGNRAMDMVNTNLWDGVGVQVYTDGGGPYTLTWNQTPDVLDSGVALPTSIDGPVFIRWRRVNNLMHADFASQQTLEGITTGSTEGYVLTSVSGVSAWALPSGSGGGIPTLNGHGTNLTVRPTPSGTNSSLYIRDNAGGLAAEFMSNGTFRLYGIPISNIGYQFLDPNFAGGTASILNMSGDVLGGKVGIGSNIIAQATLQVNQGSTGLEGFRLVGLGVGTNNILKVQRIDNTPVLMINSNATQIVVTDAAMSYSISTNTAVANSTNFVLNMLQNEIFMASNTITNLINIVHTTNGPPGRVTYPDWMIQTGPTNRHLFLPSELQTRIFGTNTTTFLLESNATYHIPMKCVSGTPYMSFPMKTVSP